MSEAIVFIFLVLIIALLLIFIFKKETTDRAQSESIRDLERRITDLMTSQLNEIRQNVSGSSEAMYRQIYDFAKETTMLREDLKDVSEKVGKVSTFQDIFKSPKLRGQWGESSLEHMLSQHFPSELLEKQHLFSSGEKVDAILKLPNKKLLSIDSKFPFDNFEKMIGLQGEERKSFEKVFASDVKKRIDEIANKYILPSENTVDFALMYIPAEAVYYEIINNLSRKYDLNGYAWGKRIILTSPNTLYLTLRTVEYWLRDTQISKQTQEILERLNKIYKDSDILSEEFRKLGNHLKNTVSSYKNSQKRLSLFSNKVGKLLEKKKLKK